MTAHEPRDTSDVRALIADVTGLLKRKADCDAVCADPAKRGTLEHRIADDTRQSIPWKVTEKVPALLAALDDALAREARVRAAVDEYDNTSVYGDWRHIYTNANSTINSIRAALDAPADAATTTGDGT